MKKFFSSYRQLRIAAASIIGTTAMTSYSYGVSLAKRKNFKEPVLLDKLSTRLLPWRFSTNSRNTGWILHYLVGLLFAEAYASFWTADNSPSNIKTGLVIGGLSGIAAILIWKFTFDLHPLPPTIDFPRFAGQLFIAHVIFGLFAALGYNVLFSYGKCSPV